MYSKNCSLCGKKHDPKFFTQDFEKDISGLYCDSCIKKLRQNIDKMRRSHGVYSGEINKGYEGHKYKTEN